MTKLVAKKTIQSKKKKPPKKSSIIKKKPALPSCNMLDKRWIAYSWDCKSFGPYNGLSRDKITCIASEETLLEAFDALSASEVIGFDMEWKPTFQKGEKNTGPHLIQLSTLDRAYLFSIPNYPNVFDKFVQTKVLTLLNNEKILKVGFGLGTDLELLQSKLNCTPANTADLRQVMHGSEGIKRAIKSLYNLDFKKSKYVSMTDWSKPLRFLSEVQIRYAANDAHGALRVYLDWKATMAKFEAEDRMSVTNVCEVVT